VLVATLLIYPAVWKLLLVKIITLYTHDEQQIVACAVHFV
jgi:hypothetical protein